MIRMDMPNDMVFYYTLLTGESYYFSAVYWVKSNKVVIVEITEDEFWSLAKDGELKMENVPTDKFPFPIFIPEIIGDVKVFNI